MLMYSFRTVVKLTCMPALLFVTLDADFKIVVLRVGLHFQMLYSSNVYKMENPFQAWNKI